MLTKKNKKKRPLTYMTSDRLETGDNIVVCHAWESVF